MPNYIPADSLLTFDLSQFFTANSCVKRIPFSTVLMWKDVSILICIPPSLLKIRIHHVITFMMMKTTLDSIVPAVESTSAVKKYASVAMHVIHMIENLLFLLKAVVGRSLSVLFVYGQESLSVLSVNQSVYHNEFWVPICVHTMKG